MNKQINIFESDHSDFPQFSYQQSKQKKKNYKPVYRELHDVEKHTYLNFQFNENHDHRENRSETRPLKKQLSSYDKKQLKQNYLQGNFRFLVNPDYEDNITYVDPDKEIRWKTIEQVKYITNNIVGCPICLNGQHEMVFPKITRCGHMFCWPCVLRYLSFKNSKCPLCDDFLVEDDLRTVQIFHYDVIKPGEKVKLRLKRRRKSENTVYDGKSMTEDEDFTRIRKIGWDEILKLKEDETSSLIDYMGILEVEGDQDLGPYIEQCLHYVGLSMERIPKVDTTQHAHVKHNNKKHKGNGDDKKVKDIHSEEEFLYFYQEMHGLNIFLHPINNKYLRMQFADPKDLPLLIEAPLIEYNGFQQSEMSQRRYKFLNHIPLNSDVNFAEIDMKGIIPEQLNDKLTEEMKNHNSLHKELASPPLDKQYSQPLPKPMTVPSEGKYKIEFPMSPSGLKLNDKFDYPELSTINIEATNNVKNAWSELGPPKKKSQAAKKNNESEASPGLKTATVPSDPTEKENSQNSDAEMKLGFDGPSPVDNAWKTAK